MDGEDMILLRQTVAEYFRVNPAARDSVMKAYYAYHAPHFRLEPKGHNFLNGSRESKCSWCGRSRELVRHDDLPAECQKRPEMPNVTDAIRSEEEKAYALLAKAERDAKKVVAKMGMNGETLAVLHHTYGHEPESILTAIELAPLRPAYEAAMEKEKARSRGAQVKIPITVQAGAGMEGRNL
jgi:hypothetical protein